MINENKIAVAGIADTTQAIVSAVAGITDTIEAIVSANDRGLIADINCGPHPRDAAKGKGGKGKGKSIAVYLLVDTKPFGSSIAANVTNVTAVVSTKDGIAREFGTIVQDEEVEDGLRYVVVQLEKSNDGIRNENDVSMLYLTVENDEYGFTRRTGFNYRTCAR